MHEVLEMGLQSFLLPFDAELVDRGGNRRGKQRDPHDRTVVQAARRIGCALHVGRLVLCSVALELPQPEAKQPEAGEIGACSARDQRCKVNDAACKFICDPLFYRAGP